MGGGRIVTFTWAEGMREARRMAAYLRGLELPRGSKIAIVSKNTAWWILVDLAIWMAGHVSVPIYPNIDRDDVRYVLEHSETALVFVGKLDDWDEVLSGIPERIRRIAMPLATGAPNFDTWASLVEDIEPIEDDPRRGADDLATIVYTSGSTGRSKGAMHAFGPMQAAIDGLALRLDTTAEDRMLSYLPLSHVFERWAVEFGSLTGGFSLWFAESIDTFVEDLKRASPTLFVSVPRLWQKFQIGVHAKMPAEKLARLLRWPIVRRIVRRKVLSGLGLDSVRYAGTGSAPIPPELVDWYRQLGLDLLEGYGMTEDFCYSHACVPGNMRVGYVGEPYDGVDVKISDQGEILIRSPGAMLGYYKAPEMTAAAFTDDGYFYTGDRGERDERGRLRITGRVKELFKTSKGKYVAPAPIETKLQAHPDVEMACVAGAGHPQPHALVMLSPRARAQADGDGGRTRMTQEVAALIDRVNGQLAHHERLAFGTIVKDEWQIENDFLTPTMKIKRAAIEDAYGTFVDGWYAAKQQVIWEG